MTATSAQIMELLRDIESRSLQNASALPQDEVRQLWEGVLFSVSGTRLIAPLDEVKEILNMPPVLTKVPGTRPWMMGVANIRGNLLPVIDLQRFLGGTPVVVNRRSRVLVINHQGLYAGLLVGDVQGMRHFAEEQLSGIPGLTGRIADFIVKAYQFEGGVSPVFGMNRLAEDPDFRVATA
jgi:twitching motility protein PilI